jgi:branched-chain amino acid aminotransferase
MAGMILKFLLTTSFPFPLLPQHFTTALRYTLEHENLLRFFLSHFISGSLLIFLLCGYFSIFTLTTLSLQCFEGMKAYKNKDGEVLMFRPDKNMARMNSSMTRLAMPHINQDAFLACIKALLRVDESWIPDQEGFSMYIRPTAIGVSPYLGVEASHHVKLYCILSPVGPYYRSGFKPVKLYADTVNTRAWPGGMGGVKVGGNYAPSILPAVEAAAKHGASQVLWLYGADHQVTEVGAMNIFFVLKRKDGQGTELVTAPLGRGDILPGVTRDSILQLAREWETNAGPGAGEIKNMTVSERWLTMGEVLEAYKEGRVRRVC